MTALQIEIIRVKREIRDATSKRRRRDLEKYLRRLQSQKPN